MRPVAAAIADEKHGITGRVDRRNRAGDDWSGAFGGVGCHGYRVVAAELEALIAETDP
jgi:hypothetical protein